MIWLIITLLLVLVVAVFNFLQLKRRLIKLSLNEIYGKMELYVAENKMTLDNKLVYFLRCYKNLVVNPDMADIQILLLIELSTPREELKKRMRLNSEYRKTLPANFINIAREFEINTNKLVKLSRYKPDFLLFILKFYFISIFNKGAREFEKLYRISLNPQKEVSVIAYGSRMAAAC